MRLLTEEKLNKTIRGRFDYDFDTPENGLYVIEISARAKNWLQNTLKFISFFQDDDLAVEIDGKEFPKLSGKRGLFDSEAAWNGNKLAGLQQVNLFFIRLEKSGHSLHFIANQSPQLETIKIHKLNNQGVEIQSDQLPKIEPGNRRPWISIVLVNLPLEKIEIQASASQKQNSDDNDLQLKIDGQRQINDTPKSHKYWYWCGRVLQGQIKTFEKELGLPRSLHYLELWADNSPTLKKMELSLKDTANQVQLYTYQGILENEDYNRYDAAIKTIVSDWSSEFLNQADPPSTPLDPDLVKAMIYVETRMGYYEDGTDEYPSYPDIMQVADPRDKAIHVFHDDGKENTEYEVVNGNLQRLFYPEASADTPEKSIKWGVRWLYHKAQNNIQEGSNWRREWVSWEKAVLGYGPGIKEYQERVWKIYRSGIAPQGNKLWSILLPFLLIPVLLFSLFALQGKTFVTFKDTKEAKDYQATAHILSGFWFQHLPLATTHSNAGNFLALDRAEQISIKYLDIDKDGGNEILISGRYLAHFTHYLLKKEGDQYRIVYHNSQFDTFREAFRTEKIEFLEFKDVEDDPNLQVVKSDVIPYSNAPDQLWTSYHSFNKEAGNYEFYKITKENLGEQISN